MGARVDNDPSISPLSAGWTRVSKNDTASVGPGTVLTGAMAVLVPIFDPPIPGDESGFHRLGPEPPGSSACRGGYPDRDRAIRRGFRLRLLRSQ
jgi:hypothetical protein